MDHLSWETTFESSSQKIFELELWGWILVAFVREILLKYVGVFWGSTGKNGLMSCIYHSIRQIVSYVRLINLPLGLFH